MNSKILIVEDEEALYNVVKEEFEAKGYKIKVAKDGGVALEMARSFNPDIILLDLILPKKGGLEVLADLKADPALKAIPVIVLSNLSESENIKKALLLGAQDYFVKTQYSIYEVIEKVQKYLVK
ncbi:MAG: response regulator [Candidatus Staskawiczbacteria bacterium]|jgi:two-component system alkaline phosphatase synthesis response regulator PhoP